MNKNTVIRNKLFEIESLLRQIEVWRFSGRKIIFTNGCFDVLHPGHFHLLNTAASLSDKPILIVGLNMDNSVKRLKGDERPVHEFSDRAIALASLYAVDVVIGFDTDTPLDLIESIQPDILVKGGDYKVEDIVGAEFVQHYGGSVEVIPFLSGHSTTTILEKKHL